MHIWFGFGYMYTANFFWHWVTGSIFATCTYTMVHNAHSCICEYLSRVAFVCGKIFESVVTVWLGLFVAVFNSWIMLKQLKHHLYSQGRVRLHDGIHFTCVEKPQSCWNHDANGLTSCNQPSCDNWYRSLVFCCEILQCAHLIFMVSHKQASKETNIHACVRSHTSLELAQSHSWSSYTNTSGANGLGACSLMKFFIFE